MPVYKLKELLKDITEKKIWEKGEKVSEYGKFIGKDIFPEKKDNVIKVTLTGVCLDEGVVYTPSFVWEKKGEDVKLYSYDCDCEYYQKNKKPCEHVAGIFLNSLCEKEKEEEFKLIKNEKIKNIFFEGKFLSEKKERRENRVLFSIKAENRCSIKNKMIFFEFLIYDKTEKKYTKVNIKKLLKSYKEKEIILDETSREFLDFVCYLKEENEETDLKNNEVVIPDFVLEKGIEFLKKLGRNYNPKLEFPFEIYVSMNSEKYIVEFKNFTQIKTLGEKYIVYSEKNKINICEAGRNKIEKIKFMRSFEVKMEKIEIQKNILNLSDIINSIHGFGEIILDESIKSKVISDPYTSIRLFVSDPFNKGITLTPQFIYDGRSLEEYKNFIILRDAEKEKELLEKLKEKLKLYGFEKRENTYILPDKEELIYDFMANHLSYLSSQYQIRVSEKMKKREYSKIIPCVSVIVGDKINISFSFEGKSEINKREIQRILKEVGSGKEFYRISNGGIFCINTPELVELEGILSSLNVEKDEITAGTFVRDKSFFPFIENMIKNINEQTLFKIIDKRERIKKYVVLRNCGFLKLYQKRTVQELLILRQFKLGGVFFDDIGLGKCQHVAGILRTLPLQKQCLIVAPPYKIKYWEKELAVYLKKERVRAISGKYEERIKEFEKAGGDEVIIISYENFIEDYLRFEYVNFEMVIYDNPLSISKNEKRKEIMKISKGLNSGSIFCFTNGYDEKNYMDIYYMFELIKPGYLGTKETFILKYVKEREDIKRRRELLSALTKPYLIGNKKEKVLDELPEKIVVNLFLTMDDSMRGRKLYMEYINKINKTVLFYRNIENSNMRIFTFLEKMREVCCNKEKLKAVFEIFKECSREGRKVFAATKYLKAAETIYEKCRGEYEKCYFVSPDMSKKERDKIYSKMYREEYEGKSVFVVAYNISYEELQEVEYDVIIYFDPHWEKIYYKDSKKLYRKKPVEINLITEKTIEEKILKAKSLLENKIVRTYLIPESKRTKEKPKFTRDEFMELLYV